MVDELRHEGDEEGEALRVERGDDEGMAEDAAGRCRRCVCDVGQLRLGAPEPDAEIDQIGRADPLERGEQRRRGEEQRAEPGERQRHRREVAEGDPGGRGDGDPLALRQCVADDEQHRRPRDEQEHDRGGGEGDPGGEVHDGFLAISTEGSRRIRPGVKPGPDKSRREPEFLRLPPAELLRAARRPGRARRSRPCGGN